MTDKKITKDDIRKACNEVFHNRLPVDRKAKLTIFCETPEELERVTKYWNNLFKESFIESLDELQSRKTNNNKNEENL